MSKVVRVHDFLIKKDPEKYAELLNIRENKETPAEADKRLTNANELLLTELQAVQDENKELQEMTNTAAEKFRNQSNTMKKLRKENKDLNNHIEDIKELKSQVDVQKEELEKELEHLKEEQTQLCIDIEQLTEEKENKKGKKKVDVEVVDKPEDYPTGEQEEGRY